MEQAKADSIPRFLLRSAVIHSLTYMAAGLLASSLLDYRGLFEEPIIRDFMLPFGSASVAWGPWLQPLRGLVLGAAILPFRTFLAERPRGYLYLWAIFLCFGIFGTPAAAPCSFEGLVYTRLPLWYHLIGLPEICLQTLAYSWLLHLYLRHPLGILRELPPIFGRLLAAVSGSCFAFVGYAGVSILFALAAGQSVSGNADSMNLKTMGLFAAPFLLNAALILLAGYLPPAARRLAPLALAAYAFNALAVAAYQGLVLGGINSAYALLAPILPALIAAFVARSALKSPA